VDAERHALHSLEALQAMLSWELDPAERRWRELFARYNALLARLQEGGDAGCGTPEVRQRAKEQLRLLQEHCRHGVSGDDHPTPADGLGSLRQCTSLLLLATAVGKLCLRVLGKSVAPYRSLAVTV